jgi:hypothetical protein
VSSVRVTRQKLIDLAKRECLLQAEQGDVLAGYLVGSVAQGEPLLAGAADIDLVLIHRDDPPQARQIKPLSEEIHLDIAHHSIAFYDQPRELRLHPWWGPAIAEPLFLHDPTHLFELAQAGARGQFFRPDNVHTRGQAFLTDAQHELAQARIAGGWHRFYLQAVMDAANAAASLAGPPAAGRRAWLTLERRLQSLDPSTLLESCLALIGSAQLWTHLQAWIGSWAKAFDDLNGQATPALQPARRTYWLRGFQALLEAGRPDAVLWPLFRIWTRTLEAGPAGPEDAAHRPHYEAALAEAGLSDSARASRCDQLEAFIDHVEERLETWAERNGV